MALLYQATAEKIIEQINNGSLRQGDKLPSIRQLSKQLQVSIGTIQQAYAELEDQQLITPKNRSGYYINRPQRISIPTPKTPSLKKEPCRVNVIETAMSVMMDSSQKASIRMGSASPNLSGVALKQLRKSIAKFAYEIPSFYEHPQGYPRLRQQLARRSITTGKPFGAEEIIITSGCQEALNLALRCITNPGDIIAVESPCYYGILQTLEVLGLKVVEVPVESDSGIDLSRLEELLAQWPIKGILLNPIYSNPTGYCLTDQKKQALVDLLKLHDLPLIEDDIYADLGWHESRPRSIHSFDTEGRVILCSSVSKTLSQDLRVGWMVPGRYFDQAKILKFVSTLCSPSLQQYGLADFLSTQRLERHIRWVTGEYYRRQRLFLNLIKRWFPEETQATQPQGGYICWIELPKEVDSTQLYQEALAIGIGITPGDLYSPTKQFKNFIRLNYGIAEDDEIEFAIKELARLINTHNRSPLNKGLRNGYITE